MNAAWKLVTSPYQGADGWDGNCTTDHPDWGVAVLDSGTGQWRPARGDEQSAILALKPREQAAPPDHLPEPITTA